MNTTTKHQGYMGSIVVSIEDNVLHGKILHIQDMVAYEADTPADLQVAFTEAVDEYLADCAELGKEPNKPFSGTFNVRVGEKLHRESVIMAVQQGETLNEFVSLALKDRVNGGVVQEIHHHRHMSITVEGGDYEGAMPENVSPIFANRTAGKHFGSLQ